MKIAVVGAGNAGSFTALHWSWYARHAGVEVELIYNPDTPPERVGQATLLDPPRLLWAATGFNWYQNKIHATFKSGILYEGWGKANDEVFHPFPADRMAMHYCPWEMQNSILNSGHFKVTEGEVDPKDVDADYVFDCRGKPKDFTDYDELTNPINAAILAKPNWNVAEAFWSRHVATPDGWTFVIPTHESSPSYDYCVGYCYNSNITSKEDAEKNFLSMFDVEITKHVTFNNYVAKNPIIDNRIFLNGNRLFFLEPMESSSTQTYLQWSRGVFDLIMNKNTSFQECEWDVKRYIEQTKNFVLWHYQFGSKYDTPFWNYAKTLSFEDNEFDAYLEHAKKCNQYQVIPDSYGGNTIDTLYSQWPVYSFKCWYDGMVIEQKI
jgi:hypothetical protein